MRKNGKMRKEGLKCMWEETYMGWRCETIVEKEIQKYCIISIGNKHRAILNIEIQKRLFY